MNYKSLSNEEKNLIQEIQDAFHIDELLRMRKVEISNLISDYMSLGTINGEKYINFEMNNARELGLSGQEVISFLTYRFITNVIRDIFLKKGYKYSDEEFTDLAIEVVKMSASNSI